MKKYIKKTSAFILLIVWIFVSHPAEIEQVQISDSLKGYLNYGAENNPGLKAAFNLWKAELEKVAQVKSLPDPTFNFAYFVREVETKVGPQQMKVGLMQKFPWFGKLKLRGNIFFERSRALKENFERLKLELFYKVKKLYYDYYYVYRSIVIIKK
ncbi:MAG: TolC family protein, partial [Candidatus Aminicenantes bacterium]|nr:TolC family protein [Candidatus Aminicenantes bacterium]